MQKKFAIKRHPQGLLAIADAELIGKTFSEGEYEIKVSKEFYFEKFVDSKTAIELAKKAKNVNALGKDICSVLVSENLIDQKNVRKVCGIPHAQIYEI
jgi:hypothetical protein